MDGFGSPDSQAKGATRAAPFVERYRAQHDRGEPVDAVIPDLIADLLHYAARHGEERRPIDVLDRAWADYSGEAPDE